MLKYVVNTYSYYVNTFEIRLCNVDFVILIIICKIIINIEIIIKLFIFICDDWK